MAPTVGKTTVGRGRSCPARCHLLDPGRYDAVTFDCYGTLVDWERGILEAVRPLLRARGSTVPDEDVLTLFGALESAAEAGAFVPYREVLRYVLAGMLEELTGAPPERDQADVLSESMVRWPVFRDTVASLQRLRAAAPLGVLSNVDDDLFAGTRPALGVNLDWVVTAQQVGSYKPDAANFHALLARLEMPPSRVLHVAQSLFHDVAPARALGLDTVWVNRRAGRGGGGATPPARAVPTLEVPDLETLVACLGL